MPSSKTETFKNMQQATGNSHQRKGPSTSTSRNNNNNIATLQSQRAPRNNDIDDESNELAMMESSSMDPPLSGIYYPMLQQRYKRELENSATVPLLPRIVGGLRDQVERVKACTCKKSNCLKLYCDCFSGGIHCNAYCNCNGCLNDGAPQRQGFRDKAILAALERNPHSFRSRTDSSGGVNNGVDQKNAAVAAASRAQDSSSATSLSSAAPVVPTAASMNYISAATGKPTGGCFCKKSRCLKKYCECYNVEVFCSSKCRCLDCQNVQENRALATTRQGPDHHHQPRAGYPMVPANNRAAPARGAMPPTGRDYPAEARNADSPRGPEMLTPSSRAIPMKLPNGQPSATLAFGQSEEQGTTAHSFGKRNDNAKKRKAPTEQELEQKWSFEAQDVMGTFEAMKHELLERKRDAGLIEGDLALSLSREYSYYDLVGSALLASVEIDLVDIMNSVKEAEQQARKVFGEGKKQAEEQQQSNDGVSPMDVDTPASNRSNMDASQSKPADAFEASLLCTEDIGDDLPLEPPTKSPKVMDSQTVNATVQAAQDAALMRELSRMVRRRALEMSEARMSNNSMPL